MEEWDEGAGVCLGWGELTKGVLVVEAVRVKKKEEGMSQRELKHNERNRPTEASKYD